MRNVAGYRCYRCGGFLPIGHAIDSRGCPSCIDVAPSNLHIAYCANTDLAVAPQTTVSLPSLWRYAKRLPFDAPEAVSLGEGLTPLLPAERLAAQLGVFRLFIKNEGYNPTWSHKDRFSTVAVTAARELSAGVVATSSTGNAGASLAAYAAKAGLTCVVATLAGSAGPMLAQIRKYGAQVVPFDKKSDRWAFLEEGVKRFGWYVTSPYRHPVVGSHPVGIEGYKTIAFEIVEQMHGAVPDWCVLPVCYGDALAGVWLGFRELLSSGEIDRIPRLLAAEVHGSLQRALEQQTDSIPDMPALYETLAVSVGATRSTFQALKALRETRGVAVSVPNEGLIALQEQVAATEGMFLELSSATCIAAIKTARRQGIIEKHESVVAVVTASGLKDVDRSSLTGSYKTFADVAAALGEFEVQGGAHPVHGPLYLGT
ncbi:UNVERIFIED_ORG: threonine synthase [Rhizobium sp. SORGH_AS260]|uniref:threonine synthase n=1 Tax=Agrobacterium sp. SORGH_AS_0440 TaxID=3041757 RepID=UPI00114DAAF1|nr:threonine synthase [Agrobacterium sp. SORGH_AS_0440]MDP9734791.1 threonine synthase [Rhizobium sp. SORGH_AS_0285]MDP9757010.1 threonine synthase [Rhizobium sp. SORGH_AS_0260]MDR6083741.1 threonine synthase [Agrobacterium sp. SORGH_AS_0440]